MHPYLLLTLFLRDEVAEEGLVGWSDVETGQTDVETGEMDTETGGT